MWNLFKSKPVPGEKPAEEDRELETRQLRARFEQKFRALSQRIKQSQEFFSVYAQVPPREEQLSVTLEEVIATLEGLTSIIEQLSREMAHTQEQLEELKRARHMVANHHTIVADLQDSYTDQIRTIYADHEKALQATAAHQDQLNQQLHQLRLENEAVKEELAHSKQACINLEIEREKLKEANLLLQEEVQELSLKCHRFLEGSLDAKKIINFASIKLEYIFYYGRLKEGVSQFLSIGEFQELKRVSKFFRHALQKEQAKFLAKSIRKLYQRRQSLEAANLKHYEKVMELFPIENIKFNALKYLHFRIKPASYILPYLQEDVDYPTPKTDPDKDKNRFNWRGLFASEKQKKEDSKFNLSQLKNEEEFRRVEARVEATFKTILSIRLPEDLEYFGETMERQLGELKEALGNRGRGQTAWTAELHCLCRFMYLEINELYNLLQSVFGELVVKSRRLANVQEAHDELKENETVLRKLIENLSHDKAALETKAVLIENQILKRSLEKDTMANSFELISVEATQNRLRYENLLAEHTQVRRTLEKKIEERKQFDQNLAKIRKELEGLEGSPARERKLSEGSVYSEEASLKEAAI